MKPERDPSFPMFAADWLTGEATTAMEPEQEGAFVRLLCYSWLAKPPCSLPNDDKILAQVSKLGSRWKKLGAAVKAQFQEGEDGRLRNAKLFKQWEKREAYRRSQGEKGRKGGRPKNETQNKAEEKQDAGSGLNSPKAHESLSCTSSFASTNPNQEKEKPAAIGRAERVPSTKRIDWLIEQRRKVDERADRTGLRENDPDLYAEEVKNATGYTPADLDRLLTRWRLEIAS